ncbi:MAG: oxidoreductase [Dehalococcoidia bacterium]|nr:oxidoreductase [Dehalococcoidia bacterium]
MLGFLGGTGPEGRGLALRLALAGERVIIGSREAARAEEAATGLKALGHLSEVYSGLNEEVARRGDIVFISVPFPAQRGLLEPLQEALSGKVVVDTVSPLAFSQGRFRTLAVEEGSAALQAQAILPGSRVVAAFQTVSAQDLLVPNRVLEGDVVVCGDDEEARGVVMSLAKLIPDLRAVNGGGLDSSRYVEGITALLLNINRLYRGRSGIRVVGI